MLLIINDLKRDELREKGRIKFSFWAFQYSDVSKSLFSEHIDFLNKSGFRKYFKLNNFNIIGGVLMLPAFTVFMIDILGRIAQGDLTHYNRGIYNFLSHTPLYWTPVLFTWIIAFPAIAIILNIISVLKNRNNRVFVRKNYASFLILFFGLFLLFLVKFHDFAPCFVHGLFLKGFGNLNLIIGVCSKA